MKYFFLLLFSANMAFAFESVIEPSAAPQKQKTQRVADGVDFGEWEEDFNKSMNKAKVRVEKCELKSKNCKFEKYQALDPELEVVH